MKNKAIIFDIDGTAIDSPGQKLPSDRLVAAVRKLEDSYFLCAATGRAGLFAKPVIEGLSLQDPCIVSSGTQIYDPKTDEVLWQCNIEPADLEAAVEVAKQYPEIKVLHNDYVEDDYLEGKLSSDAIDTSTPTYFFELIFVPEKQAPEIITRLSEIEGLAITMVVAQREGFKDIHITNRNATKEHAVAELLKLIKIDKENTIGMGDGHNDIHLFNAVNKKIAMGNAVDELKEFADRVIGNVQDDGMAEYLESLID